MACQVLFGLFVCEVSVQLRRIEGKHSPLSYAQMVFGMLVIIEVIFPLVLHVVATFRPAERTPELAG